MELREAAFWNAWFVAALPSRASSFPARQMAQLRRRHSYQEGHWTFFRFVHTADIHLQRATAWFHDLAEVTKATQVLFSTHHQYLVGIVRAPLGESLSVVSSYDELIAQAV